MKKVILVLMLFVGLFILNGCNQWRDNSDKEVIVPNNMEVNETPNKEVDEFPDDQKVDNGTSTDDSIMDTYTIEITKDGFDPSNLTISVGDKINFINKDVAQHWPASAVHPTHTEYPGSDIEKCGTSEQNTIFDACKGLNENETFSFIFNEEGTWKYHDHLDVTKFGTIIVE